MQERLKSLLIRTPLEDPAQRLRWLWRLRRLDAHPELHAILAEERVIDLLLERLLGPESCCVDVGCHLGATLSAFLRLSPRGRHVAFEPIPAKAAWIRRKFPEVDLYPVALAETEGVATFFVNRRRSGFSGLRRHGEEEGDREYDGIPVRTARLDDVLPPARRVDLLKVDVEGGELSVLRGATGVLARWRPWIVFESTRSGLNAHGTSAEEVFAWLEAHGYAVWLPAERLASRGPLTLERFTAAQVYPFQAFNFLAGPADRA